MSDNWIIITSQKYDFIPNDTAERQLIDYINEIIKSKDKIEIVKTEEIRFIDCGGNFESITCPNCQKEIEIKFWQQKMDEDYTNNSFQLNKYKFPCCHNEFNLNDLIYSWEQGFGKYSIEILNPVIDELTIENIDKIEEIARTQIRTIYRHI